MAENLTDTFYPAEGSFHGYGTQLMVGNGASPESFEAIAEVRSIRFGEMVTANFDRTHLRSPDAHTELLAALRSSGAFSCTLNWRPKHESQNNAGDPASVSFQDGGLLAIWRSRELRNYKVVLSDDSPATEVPFTAFISRFQPGEVGATAGPDLTVEFQPINGAWHADLP